MSLFSFAMVQRAGFHHFTGTNDDGDAEFFPSLEKPPAPLFCRFDYKQKEVLDKSGNRVISEASLITEERLTPLDIVVFEGKNYTVKSTSPRHNAFGELDHFEVIL